jgi:hypothetical protein
MAGHRLRVEGGDAMPEDDPGNYARRGVEREGTDLIDDNYFSRSATIRIPGP